ncbi:MAG: DUF4252 domain-containing protein [Saprospiraceae bacterium]
MKKIFFLLLAAQIQLTTLSAQNDGVQNFIEQHKQDQGFTYAFLSKDLFEVSTQTKVNDETWDGLHKVVKNIGSLHILAADSISNALVLYREAKSLIKGDNFVELLTVRDGNENVRIWVKSEEDMVTNLVLLVGTPDEFVLVCFAGNLELGNVAELAKLFNSEEATQLAQTSAAIAIEFGVNPNPSSGQITITYSDEQDPPALLTVMDQNGRTVSSLALSSTASQQISLKGLPTGMYWVQLKTQAGKIGVKPLQVIKG